jgi:hypothetical protein
MATSQNEFYRGVEAASAALTPTSAATPAAAAAAVHAALAGLLAPTPDSPPRECRAGCAACCHFPVGVTWPEAIALAAAIEADGVLRPMVLAAAEAVANQSWGQLAGVPCPLLQAGRCGAYAVRPVPCRALASASAAACAAALQGDRGSDVPRDEVAFWRGLGATAALAGGAVPGIRELRSAVAAVLQAAPGDRAAAFLASRPAG